MGDGSGSFRNFVIRDRTTSATALAQAAFERGTYRHETCPECEPRVLELLQLIYANDDRFPRVFAWEGRRLYAQGPFPRSLVGRGEVDVVFFFNGIPANAVQIRLQ